MSMCESILTIALVCTVKYLHYCDYYYTLGNDSQSTPKLIAYIQTNIRSELSKTERRDNYSPLSGKIAGQIFMLLHFRERNGFPDFNAC